MNFAKEKTLANYFLVKKLKITKFDFLSKREHLQKLRAMG